MNVLSERAAVLILGLALLALAFPFVLAWPWLTETVSRPADGAFLRTLQGHTSYVNSVAFSPDGATLASASWDNTVRLWRVANGILLHTLQHTGRYGVAFSPDGATLASGSQDSTVGLWRAADGALIHTLLGHMSWANTVAFSPDGATVASGSYDKTVRLWRVADGSLLRTLQAHELRE